MSCTRDISTATSDFAVVINVVVHFQGQNAKLHSALTAYPKGPVVW